MPIFIFQHWPCVRVFWSWAKEFFLPVFLLKALWAELRVLSRPLGHLKKGWYTYYLTMELTTKFSWGGQLNCEHHVICKDWNYFCSFTVFPLTPEGSTSCKCHQEKNKMWNWCPVIIFIPIHNKLKCWDILIAFSILDSLFGCGFPDVS